MASSNAKDLPASQLSGESAAGSDSSEMTARHAAYKVIRATFSNGSMCCWLLLSVNVPAASMQETTPS